jgi:hypothetical protein
MDLRIGAGVALIGTFVMLFGGAVLSPPGIYGEPDIGARLETIAAHQTRWFASQAVSGLALALAPVGYVLLALHFRQGGGGTLGAFAAGCILVGSLIGEVYLYRFAVDPGTYWERSSALLQAAVWLTIAGSFLFGLIFLQGGLPAWIGYITLLASASSAIVYLFANVPSFFLVSLLYLVAMLIGIVVLRQ